MANKQRNVYRRKGAKKMALTRKMLSAMDIPAEKIDEIINAHRETVDALKEEQDKLQKQYDELKESNKENADAKKELEKVNAELEKIKGGDWENKYNTLKSEHDTYKADVEAKATKAAKEKAYRKLLEEAGISSKRIDSVIKVSDIDGVKLDKDGNIEDAEKITESVKTEWADFITTTGTKGADVSNPPANGGNNNGNHTSHAAKLAAQYRNSRYGNPTKED